MFDIEQAIAKWRRQMLAGGIKTPATLDELESHLREEVERQRRLGVLEPQAFELAVDRIGQAVTLKNEFAKVQGKGLSLLWKLKSLVLDRREIPVPSIEKFAPVAQEALELAAGESRQFHHDFVGTEHVLLGLITSKSGTVANIVRSLGVDAETIRAEIEKMVGKGPERKLPGIIPFTPRARRALQLAAAEAKSLDQPRIGAEHIFLGLVIGGEGVAPLVLEKMGVGLERLRQEVLKEMRVNPRLNPPAEI